MPSLNAQLMLATARARFSAFQLRLPPVASAGGVQANVLASGLRTGGMTKVASAPQQVQRGTPLPCPPALFVAASDDLRDIEQQRARSNAMDAYLSRICDAVVQAHNTWRQLARLVQVTINGPQALGGSLQAPGLANEIRARAPQQEQWQRSRTEAIAAGIGTCWESWQRSVTVPGLPWYPGFAALPSPVAPPTPNVPTPLSALVQHPFHLSTLQLKAQMQGRYAGDNEWPGELFEAVASGFERAFQLWVPCQMVMNVLGTGPVPTFAPPYVPVGPVVGGTAAQLPGSWL